MQIRCEKCKTEYSLDEKLLAPKGSPVRCTQCGNVFRAFPPTSRPAVGTLPPPDPAVPWVLHRKSGETRKFLDTKKLQNFIADGKATGADLVSRFGGPWKNIAVTTELKGFLRVSRNAASRAINQGTPGQQATGGTRQSTYQGSAPRQSTPAVPAQSNIAHKPVNIRTVPSQRTTEPPPANRPAGRSSQPPLVGSPSQVPKQPVLTHDIADNSDISPHDEVTRVAPNPFFYFSERDKQKAAQSASTKTSPKSDLVVASAARVFDDPLDNDVTQKTTLTKKREREQSPSLPLAADSSLQKTQKNSPGIISGKAPIADSASSQKAAAPSARSVAPEKKVDTTPAVVTASSAAGTTQKSAGALATSESAARQPTAVASSSTVTPAGQTETGLGEPAKTTTESAVQPSVAATSESTPPLEPTTATDFSTAKSDAPTVSPARESTPSTPLSPTPSSETSGTAATRITGEAEIDFSGVPVTFEEEWSTGDDDISHDEPDWTQSSSAISSMADTGAEYKARKRSRGVIIAIISLMGVLGVGAGYLWFFQKDLLMSHFGEVQDSKKEARLQTLLIEARELVLLDTPSDFAQAEKKYLQVLTIDNANVDGLTGLAQMYLIWAQQLQDELLDATLDFNNVNNDDAANAVPDETLETIRKNFEARLADGRRRVHQSLTINPAHALSNLVAAEAELLDGNLEKAKTYMEKGRSPQAVQNASLVSAKIGIAGQQDDVEIIGMLKSIVTAEPRLRVLNRLARVQLHAGQKDDARQSIDRILSLNSRHTAALRLKKRIESDKTVSLVPAPATPADSDEHTPDEETAAVPAAPKKSDDAETKADTKKDIITQQQPPASMTVYQLLRKASAAQHAGRSQEAVTLFNLALEKEPDNIEALNGMGYAYNALGSRGQAIAKFKRALTVNPGFGPSQIGMAQTYKMMGQNAEALKWFERYMSTNPSGSQAGIAQRNIDDLKPLVTSTPNGPTEESSAGQPDSGTSSSATPATSPDASPSEEQTAPSGTSRTADQTEPSLPPAAPSTPPAAEAEEPNPAGDASPDMAD